LPLFSGPTFLFFTGLAWFPQLCQYLIIFNPGPLPLCGVVVETSVSLHCTLPAGCCEQIDMVHTGTEF
jgi:hypothetical protein